MASCALGGGKTEEGQTPLTKLKEDQVINIEVPVFPKSTRWAERSTVGKEARLG